MDENKIKKYLIAYHNIIIDSINELRSKKGVTITRLTLKKVMEKTTSEFLGVLKSSIARDVYKDLQLDSKQRILEKFQASLSTVDPMNDKEIKEIVVKYHAVIEEVAKFLKIVLRLDLKGKEEKEVLLEISKEWSKQLIGKNSISEYTVVEARKAHDWIMILYGFAREATRMILKQGTYQNIINSNQWYMEKDGNQPKPSAF